MDATRRTVERIQIGLFNGRFWIHRWSMRSILVTGASRGIGLELTRQCLAREDRVYATCRQPDKAEELQALKSESDLLSVRALDVCRQKSVETLAEELRDAGAKFDWVVSNAGVHNGERFNHWSEKAFLEVFHTNCVGPAMVAQGFRRLMRPGGMLIQISSRIGSFASKINPEGPSDAYAMSKAALNMLTLRLAEKWKPWKLGVVSLSPGWVKTDMGGKEAELEVDDAVRQILATLDKLTLEHSGQFLGADGKQVDF